MTYGIVEDVPVHDADLIRRVRHGDGESFALLHRRHYEAALRVARIYASSHHTAEEITAEAFARMYSTLQRDAGPTESFRAYLFTVVRNISKEVGATSAREELVDDFSPFELTRPHHQPVGADFGAGMVGDAFFSLPRRWQTALWYVEVEGFPTAEAAALLGLRPNTMAALVYRAREGLRSAYLQQHAGAGITVGCEPYRAKLSAFVRGTLRKRDRMAVTDHLATCAECSSVRDDLVAVNPRLRSAIVPRSDLSITSP